MLARIFRLQKKDVERVYKKGRTLRFNNFLIRASENRARHGRFAVVIPKKVLNRAVDRNLARRKIYQTLGDMKDLWQSKPFDIIISFRKYDTNELEPAIRQFFEAQK